MNERQVNDPLMFHILAQLDQWGQAEAPLRIIREKQSYIVGHERRRCTDGAAYLDSACKLTYLKAKNTWKLFCKRADGQWRLYGAYEGFDDALKEVRADPEGCFWG